jgi:RimJ/RimL family protein N-acetyltransferase
MHITIESDAVGWQVRRRTASRNPCQHAAVPVPMDIPVITDGVITLRPWTPEDADFLWDASADPAIQRYSLSRSRPFTLAEAQAQFGEREGYLLSADASGRPSGSLAIADAVTAVPLGQCGIDGWSPGAVAQIGYWLTPKARGRGIATRAVELLTNWLFTLGAGRVFLTVVDDNPASMRVAQRAGFRMDGVTGKQSIWSGRAHEVLAFAVHAEEWERR